MIISLNVRGGEPWKRWSYPGGEVGIIYQAPCAGLPTVLEARINNPTQLIELVLATDALRHYYQELPHTLRIGYMPYGRQDRYDMIGACFGLRQIAGILDSLGYRTIEMIDPHSPATEAAFHRSEVVVDDGAEMFRRWLDAVNIDKADCVLVAPDAGASKRTRTWATYIGQSDVIQCSKVRNSTNGMLTDFKVASAAAWTSQNNVIIADDICDGGRTFLGVADALRKEDISVKLHLYTTHGIYSGDALNRLREKFTHIGSTDSWQSLPSITVPYFQA